MAETSSLEGSDPFSIFADWYEAAQNCGLSEPTHVHLSTCDATGQPSGRVVLLKSFDARGFVFYTNLRSRKGQELAENPRAALCFYWGPLERQVRVVGHTEAVTVEEADAYFASRARGSQIGAWASDQSALLDRRETLIRRVEEEEARFGDGEVPRPPHWSGTRVVPREIEFWQGMPSRLHDRVRFVRQDSLWVRDMLYP